MSMYTKDRIRLNVSNLCNFKCPNCHVFELGENILPSKVMSQDLMELSIRKAIEVVKLKNNQELMISLYGGETLANKKAIFHCIELFKDYFEGVKLEWVINTNGSLLKEEDILFLKKHNIEIHISVDGREEIHNLSRPTHQGKGTFQMVKAALELIKKHKAPVQMNSYVQPTNFHHLKDLVDIAVRFGIPKIYLDQFYSHEMGSPDNLVNEYRKVFLYGASRNVNVTGPWSLVLESFLRNKDCKTASIPFFSIDVNLDGSFFFSTLIESKKFGLHIDQLIPMFKTDQFKAINNSFFSKHEKSCKNCSLEKSCFGKAINQVEYHIGLNAETSNSCYFFKKWIAYQTADVFIENRKKFDLISAYDRQDISDLVSLLDNLIDQLELKLWPLNQKIQIQVFKYFEELVLASRIEYLPLWVKTLVPGTRVLLILENSAPPGLVHELGHIFLNSIPHTLPTWIEEGFCEWLRDPEFRPELVKQSLLKGNFLKSKFLKTKREPFLFKELDDSHMLENYAYIQAGQFINYLAHAYGPGIPIDIVKMSQARPFEEAIEVATGRQINNHISDFLILIGK